MPAVVVQSFDGQQPMECIGVGKDFLYTQRDGGFFSKNASPREIRIYAPEMKLRRLNGYAGLHNVIGRVRSPKSCRLLARLIGTVPPRPLPVAISALPHDPDSCAAFPRDERRQILFHYRLPSP
jgi:hypothetical protein